ncbi:MAG: peptidylprolyl isomerase [Planctomycetota bacterium]|jgi:parvulin-like peptidyl-prolyl isomerase|nr:peptidylprolyl isomerase [Planctomycetota bacterium]
MMVRIACLCLLLAAPLLAEEQVVDRVVRYVNADIITAGDIWERARAKADLMKRRGESLPSDPASWEAFRTEVLDDATEELVLVQEADRMGILIDDRPLKRQIRIEASRYSETLAHQSRLLEVRIRQSKIRTVKRYFANVHVSPEDVARAYESRKADFQRPTRHHAFRILVRPSTETQYEAISQRLLGVFRQSQVDPTAEIAAVVTPEVRRSYLDSRDAPQQRLDILADVAAQILAAAPQQPGKDTELLLEQARVSLQGIEKLRSPQQVREMLEALAGEVSAISEAAARREAFVAAARRVSEGPKADMGGDLGWQEPGDIGGETDQQIEALTPGTVSAVFESDGGLVLIYLAEREEARQRSLAEVSAELRTQIEDELYDLAVKRVVHSLVARAHIKDLEALSLQDIQDVVGTTENAATLSEGSEVEVIERPRLDDFGPGEAD